MDLKKASGVFLTIQYLILRSNGWVARRFCFASSVRVMISKSQLSSARVLLWLWGQHSTSPRFCARVCCSASWPWLMFLASVPVTGSGPYFPRPDLGSVWNKPFYLKKKNSLALLRVLHRNIDKTCFYALEVLDTSFSFFIWIQNDLDAFFFI